MARPLSYPQLQLRLLELVFESADNVARRAAAEFGLSRQAVNKHLRELVREGLVISEGATRSRKYALVQVEDDKTFSLEGLAEHDVWEGFVRPYLTGLSDNVRAVCQYGVTEMVNNAIDHSSGRRVRLVLVMNPIRVQISVIDDGIGIFKKVREAFKLERESDVILELSKGKLTTDPSRHSGEGIFFTSRVFDQYTLYSGSLFFIHFPDNDDWLVEQGDPIAGTIVTMVISPASDRTTTEVFERYAAPDTYHFDVTHVPVKLAQLGEDSLVSRSQAKRLVTRFERFTRVVLNFSGVNTIGQAFADEIFRVFGRSHPEIELSWVNANDAVKGMISRALAGESR